MITYRIQQTQRGDYIVRNPGGREMARFTTEPEAQGWIVQQNITEMDAHAAATRVAEEQRAFDATVPDLNAVQLEWQEWRSRLYDRLQWDGKRLAQYRAHLDNVPAGDGPGTTGSHSYAHQEDVLTREQREHQEGRALYDRAVTLDEQIKAARRANDVASLAARLAEAQAMLPELANAAGSAYTPTRPDPDASRHDAIQVRVNEYERRRIQELATQAGVPTVSEYIRQRALAD